MSRRPAWHERSSAAIRAQRQRELYESSPKIGDTPEFKERTAAIIRDAKLRLLQGSKAA